MNKKAINIQDAVSAKLHIIAEDLHSDKITPAVGDTVSALGRRYARHMHGLRCKHACMAPSGNPSLMAVCRYD